ncbi:GTP 3',8-cyclase MoaA [Candidatus Formimonas warabiya]|uniref:GTP 3',8-cyclase n=1 Tax=Formimonas warabiya TaxID=1761012 RepID=A0A3G1KML0_FORW1|nr:GTP 3',8-cyclase MoaA [Candidatus Formimonas warabiya]ATW23654.1 cyclic pyranopterin phosphate synthase MoaA [Candidatus Formimonas warabiya]
MIDSYGRDIDYLRISVTDLCNLKCRYCMPEKGVNKKNHHEILRLETIEKVAQAAVKLGINKIRLTGGEPLIRKGIIDLVNRIAQLKTKGLKDLGLTTNGILLKEYALQLRKAGLTRVNVSIDSLDQAKFQTITRGGNVQDVLDGIKAAKEAGLLPKLNVVLIGGFNDEEIEDFVYMTLEDDVEVRFIELMPLGEAANWDKKHFLSGTEIMNRVPRLIPLPFKGHGGVARLYKLPNSKGKVGIISPLSSHFCHYCNRIRITPDGKLKPCLHSNMELDIKNYREEYLEKFLMDGIKCKPLKHCIQSNDYIPIERNMNEIGG